MANSARQFWRIIALVGTLMLLAGCGPQSSYPGWYSYNAEPQGIPTDGRYGVGNDGPAVLGGTDAAFIAEFQWSVDGFGFLVAPDLPRQVLKFRHYLNTFVDAVAVVRDIGDKGHEHQIMAVLLSAPPDELWTQDTAVTYSDAFSPLDAIYQRTIPVADDEGFPGTDKVYTSATLATIFPATAFVDESGSPVAPGTFNVQCLYPTASQTQQVLSCQLALGTKQKFHI